MHTDDPIRVWGPPVALTILIVLLSTIPLPLLLLVPVLGMMIYTMHAEVFHTRLLAKSFWLTTYLRPDSPIRRMLMRSVLLRWLSICIAIPLAGITYITVYGYDFIECLVVGVAIWVARIIHQSISAPIDANLAEHFVSLAHLRVYYWLAVVLVLFSIALVSVAKGFFTDYSQATSDQLATQTIQSVKHPVRVIQHCTRTLRYFELQLLRIRDILGWPYGWLLYFFFLVPNALPAFGLVTLYEGVERVIPDLIPKARNVITDVITKITIVLTNW